MMRVHGPWQQSTDGAIALDGKLLDRDRADDPTDPEYRRQLEGVIDFDPEGAIDGGLYGFQVEDAAGAAVAIVEWHGDEHDADCREKLRLVLAAPDAVQLVREALDHFSLNHSLIDVRQWMKTAARLLAEVDGRAPCRK